MTAGSGNGVDYQPFRFAAQPVIGCLGTLQGISIVSYRGKCLIFAGFADLVSLADRIPGFSFFPGKTISDRRLVDHNTWFVRQEVNPSTQPAHANDADANNREAARFFKTVAKSTGYRTACAVPLQINE